MVCKWEYQSPLGKMLLASENGSLIGLWFENQAHFGKNVELANAVFQETDVIKQTQNWLNCYFAGKVPKEMLPLAPKGTPYQIQVWQTLLEIPYGTVVAYSDIADKISKARGKKTSARAVGNAVSKNPVSIVVPCHRVMGKNGGLTGYAAGMGTKKTLLALEGIFTA